MNDSSLATVTALTPIAAAAHSAPTMAAPEKATVSKTGIRGLFSEFRQAEHHDSLRVQIFTAHSGSTWISAKVDPRLKQINDYLKYKKLREEEAEKDPNFLTMKHRLFAELQKEHALAQYRAREKLVLQTKAFNFEDSVELFVRSKDDTAVPMKHKSYLMNVWLPFYLDKACKHPSEFHQWRKQAQAHIKLVKKIDSDERYSTHSWVSLSNTHNEYMKFLRDNGDIGDAQFFTILATITKDQRKRGLTSKSRKRNTYTLQELFDIKKLINSTYTNNLEMKLRAYGLLFGVYTGLRKGNILGLVAACLHPEDNVPNFETKDNIVSGWSRGIKGTICLENSTKTTVGTITLPMLQPDRKTIVEVARFLKANLNPKDRLVNCSPRTVGTWWEEIAKECGFRFLTPHDWKHTYATIGAVHLKQWYDSNPYLLQKCCIHEKYETTLGYINQQSAEFLKAFEKRE